MDNHLRSTLFKIALAGFAIISAFGIPVFFLVHNEYQKATLWCLFSIILLLILNVDRIEAFKLWGLETKLRLTINEAHATIDQLREVALTISRQTYNDIAFSGQIFTHISFEELYESKTALDKALKSIGASQGEINNAAHIWRLVTGRRLAALIFSDEGKLDEPAQEIWKEIKKPYYEKEQDVPSEKLEVFLNDNDLMNDFRKGRFEDYQHYINTGEIKHIENFPVGMGIPN